MRVWSLLMIAAIWVLRTTRKQEANKDRDLILRDSIKTMEAVINVIVTATIEATTAQEGAAATMADRAAEAVVMGTVDTTMAATTMVGISLIKETTQMGALHVVGEATLRETARTTDIERTMLSFSISSNMVNK